MITVVSQSISIKCDCDANEVIQSNRSLPAGWKEVRVSLDSPTGFIPKQIILCDNCLESEDLEILQTLRGLVTGA